MAVIEARSIDKRFGSVAALVDAGVALEKGRVRAIVGENGAGKSTLVKILAGVYQPDRGEILVHGKPVALTSRRQAAALGVGYVPQSLSFVGTLSPLDNHLLQRSSFALDRRAARRSLEAMAARIGFAARWEEPSEALSLAERQLAEIVSALAHGADALLLDEPTSALGPLEIERLIAAVAALAGAGVAIGLVTHRVREVLECADGVTVLRGGKVVFSGAVAGLDGEEVARLMVGDRERAPPISARSAGEPRLVVDSLSVSHALHDVSFSVRRGEIVGVAGVASQAQPALAAALAGLSPEARGHVSLDGADVTNEADKARRAGLGYVPERRSDGAPNELPVSAVASLLHLGEKGFTRFGLRRLPKETRLGRVIIERFDVRPPDPHLRCGALSGGNQQKLLVGREIERRPKAIVAHGPTQGLDLSASSAVWSELMKAAGEGAAVLVISTDLDELLAISDRILVLAAGRIAGEFDVAASRDDPAALAHRIGEAMTGAGTGKAA